ncbi:hypothetical protein HMPREF0373_00113 [Eubacterium ramulus ATCC 29099]|uniref:Uncharacterized protein n=1 Tax=Eubacterium ramulus ATCC 29099 TaxID=1256908 RepID=U2PPT3_EUBRA|nr:hypothetical protein HMPREF0373_00113 [Eubacterium ramulus ATCC 29099]
MCWAGGSEKNTADENVRLYDFLSLRSFFSLQIAEGHLSTIVEAQVDSDFLYIVT